MRSGHTKSSHGSGDASTLGGTRIGIFGDGYRYLLRTVTAGDRSLTSSLTWYYSAGGTPCGRKSSTVYFRVITRFVAYSMRCNVASQLGRIAATAYGCPTATRG